MLTATLGFARERLHYEIIHLLGLSFLLLVATTAPAQDEIPVYAGQNKAAIPYTNRGTALFKEGDDPGAIVNLSRAIQLDPTMWPAYLERAQVFMKQGKWSLALDDLNTAARLRPDRSQIFSVRAVVYSHFHQATATLADLDKALGLGRESKGRAEMLNMRAWIRATATDSKLRDGRQAIADATEACKAKGDDAEYIDTLAVAHAETGDFASAIRFEEQALHVGGTRQEVAKQLREHFTAFKHRTPIRDDVWK